MSKKRGQAITIDLVMAFVVFLVGIGAFYSYLGNLQDVRTANVDLDVQSSFVFSNLMMNLEKEPEVTIGGIPTEINFLSKDGYYINESYLDNFGDLDYYLDDTPSPGGDGFSDSETLHYYVFSGINIGDKFKRLDFCLFFSEKDGSNVKVINHIGKNDDLIELKSSVNCGDSNQPGIVNPNPSCKLESSAENKYTHAVVITKPVVWHDSTPNTPDKLIKMNMLICGEQQ